MLSIFRTNQLFLSVLLIFYAGILHVAQLFVPLQKLAPPTGVLSLYLWPLLTTTDWLPPVISLLLIFIQAWVANIYVHSHRLSPEMNLFPGLFLILAGSMAPDFLSLSAFHFANLCLLLSLNALTKIYKTVNCADSIFNAGMWVGLAALFEPAYLWMFIPVVAGLSILRAREIRERLMAIAGLLSPLLITGFVYQWYGQWDEFVRIQFSMAFRLTAAVPWPTTFDEIMVPGLLLCTVLVVLLRYGRYRHKMVIDVQKKIDLIFWYLLAGGLSVLTAGDLQLVDWLMILIPTGILLGLLFTYMSARIAESIHLVWLALVLFIQFLPVMH